MRHLTFLLALLLLGLSPAVADKPQGGPPGQVKKGGAPPGLAKKGGIPPGLAKKFGPAPPAHAYIALDPRRDDRAWFLIDGRWTMRDRFDSALRVEVRGAMAMPAVPPPVPLPSVGVALHVVLFE